MDATPPTPTDPVRPTPTYVVQALWPRPCQVLLFLLLGASSALLAVHAYGYCRWSHRPTELEREAVLAYRIDLNTADQAELLQIPGVGPVTAARIEEYRDAHGGFRTVDDLVAVTGIGPKNLERIRPAVTAGRRDEAEAISRVPPKSAEPIRSRKAEALTEPVNVNRATVLELQRLPGIGPKMSERIAAEREKGPFRTVDELRRVSGIGPKTLEKLRPHVTVEDDAPHVAARERE